VIAFAPLLDLLAEVPDPRRAQGQIYKLPYVLLFSILAIVTGGNSYRSIVTFIDVNCRKLNAAFGLHWRRAPAHTAICYILQGLDPAAIEPVFRRHAALLQAACVAPGQRSIALDGKTLRGSFDNFNDRPAAQVLSAFATDTALVLAHVGIAEKSNEIPAAQSLLAELRVAKDTVLTLDALHCQKNIRSRGEANLALIVPVKDNQPHLHERTQDLSNAAAPLDSAHAVTTAATATKAAPSAYSILPTHWPIPTGNPTSPRVEREVFTRDAKTGLLRRASETAFYISNTPIGANRAATAIRAHWAIETTSHYSHDVTMAKIARAADPTPAYSPACAASLSTSSRPTAPAPSARTATAPLSQASTAFSNSSSDSVEQPWGQPPPC